MTAFRTVKTKNTLCGLAMAVVLHLGVLAGSAQTYLYTYTGNDFTSVFNAANEPSYGLVPYTTSDKITGSIAFSAPLGDNYEGNPSATMLSYNFTDDVGPQNIAGNQAVFPYAATLTKTIQTENDSGNVIDSGNLDEVGVIVGEGSVTADPGVWVETVVPEPSVGLLFLSFAPLVLAPGRFKPSPPRPQLGK
jgi:hypothetical protein